LVKRIFRGLVVGMCFFLATSWAAFASQMTMEYAVSKTRPKTLLLIPSIISEDGVEKKYVDALRESQEFSDAIDQAVLSKLAKSGFKVLYLAHEEISENLEKRQLYSGVVSDYGKTIIDYSANQSMLKYNWFGLGKSAVALADLYEVDALVVSNVMLEGAVSMKTTSRKAVSHRIIFVDGETANFEAAFDGSAKFTDIANAKKLAKESKKLANSTLLEVKNARKRKPEMLSGIEIKEKRKFTSIAEEAAIVADLEKLVTDLYTPFDFASDFDEKKLIEGLERELMESNAELD